MRQYVLILSCDGEVHWRIVDGFKTKATRLPETWTLTSQPGQSYRFLLADLRRLIEKTIPTIRKSLHEVKGTAPTDRRAKGMTGSNGKSYSLRRDCIGSTRVALKAGRLIAHSDTAVSSNAEMR
jgi:hypothetical protein